MSESLAKQRSMIDLDEFERRLRRPATPNPSEEDPLAELARLVNGGEDPYRNMFDAPAASAPPVQQPAWNDAPYNPPKNHPLAGDFAAIEAGLLRGTLPDEQNWASHDPHPDFAAGPQESAYGETLPEGDWGPAYAAAPRSRKPLFLTAGVIILGLAGIGGSFALKGHVGGPREIATISAVPGPTKIQPATPDGTDVPNQDATILDKSPRPNAVALSNNQEQPVDLSRLPERAPKVLSVGNAPLTGSALSDQQVASAAITPTPAQQPSGIAALIEPRKVKTVSVRPDGTLLANDNPPQAAVARPIPPVQSAPATPVAKPSTPKSTARVVTTPKPAPTPGADGTAPLQLTGAKPKPATPASKPTRVATAEETDDATPAATNSAGGSYAVQLAAPGSEHDAKEAISKFGAKFASELGGRRPTFRKATVGAKDVYRVRVVNLSRDEATALCQKLQAASGSCFVAKN
jgi:hypothetical protein